MVNSRPAAGVSGDSFALKLEVGESWVTGRVPPGPRATSDVIRLATEGEKGWVLRTANHNA